MAKPAVRHEPYTPVNLDGQLPAFDNVDLAKIFINAGTNQGTLIYQTDEKTGVETTTPVKVFYIDMMKLFADLEEYFNSVQSSDPAEADK